MPVFRRVTVLVILLLSLAGPSLGVPLSTKYYSLDLPPDWVVINGPAKQNGAVQVLLGQKDHKASAALIVGPAQPGDAKKAADTGSQRLKGSPPAVRDGQLQFSFEQKGVKGYSVVREDAQSRLLLVLIVSGDVPQADFIYGMRSPYKALIPRKP